MGKYSVKGSPEFDALVDAHMERIAETVYESTYSKHWKALILHGGYGRGEGTPQIGLDSKELPFNDYELIVVTSVLDPLVKRSLKRMEAHLSEELGPTVVLRPMLEKNLSNCELSLLNYELKRGHRVIRGSENILSRMPSYPSEQIPLSEGTRLLMNHGKLLLDIKIRLATGKPLSYEEHHRFIKNLFKIHLAFGDCALLLRGTYNPSYGVKRNLIDKIDLSGLKDGRGVAEAYRRAVNFNEHSHFQPLETANIHVWFDETAQWFDDVFLWYERRRLNRKFRTLEKYAHGFPNLGNEGRPLSNAAHNLRAFGFGAFPDLFAHPRLRLYAALPLLLAPHADRGEIRWILRSGQSTLEGLCEVFYSLHQKFS